MSPAERALFELALAGDGPDWGERMEDARQAVLRDRMPMAMKLDLQAAFRSLELARRRYREQLGRLGGIECGPWLDEVRAELEKEGDK